MSTAEPATCELDLPLEVGDFVTVRREFLVGLPPESPEYFLGRIVEVSDDRTALVDYANMGRKSLPIEALRRTTTIHNACLVPAEVMTTIPNWREAAKAQLLEWLSERLGAKPEPERITWAEAPFIEQDVWFKLTYTLPVKALSPTE